MRGSVLQKHQTSAYSSVVSLLAPGSVRAKRSGWRTAVRLETRVVAELGGRIAPIRTASRGARCYWRLHSARTVLLEAA